MQSQSSQLQAFNSKKIIVSFDISKRMYALSSQSFGLVAIANQALADGECPAETVEHIARIAENIQKQTEQIANTLLDAKSA